mgnify:CR=1 FL=1
MIKFWTLMSGIDYISSIGEKTYTRNPLQAMKFGTIKKADIAANEWKRKYGLPVMVQVITEDDYERLAHQGFYSENL